MASPDRSDAKALLRAIGVATLGVALISLLFSGKDAATSSFPSSEMAFAQCQLFVKDRLKAPATADFPSDGRDATRALADSQYVVSSYVDSQNGFGALVRSDYTCVVSQIDSGTRWHLDSLDIRTR